MILDKVFYGILDQGAGCLIVFDEPVEDVRGTMQNPWLIQQKTYDVALDTLKNVGHVVESLYQKVGRNYRHA